MRTSSIVRKANKVILPHLRAYLLIDQPLQHQGIFIPALVLLSWFSCQRYFVRVIDIFTNPNWSKAFRRSYSIAHSIELDDHQRKDIWDIFESNMRNLYVAVAIGMYQHGHPISSSLIFSYSESSFGWDPQSKLAELFTPLSRFILVHAEGRLVAFVAFRFEYEFCENILYWSTTSVLFLSRASFTPWAL